MSDIVNPIDFLELMKMLNEKFPEFDNCEFVCVQILIRICLILKIKVDLRTIRKLSKIVDELPDEEKTTLSGIKVSTCTLKQFFSDPKNLSDTERIRWLYEMDVKFSKNSCLVEKFIKHALLNTDDLDNTLQYCQALQIIVPKKTSNRFVHHNFHRIIKYCSSAIWWALWSTYPDDWTANITYFLNRLCVECEKCVRDSRKFSLKWEEHIRYVFNNTDVYPYFLKMISPCDRCSPGRWEISKYRKILPVLGFTKKAFVEYLNEVNCHLSN